MSTTILRQTRAERVESALNDLTRRVPGTKGMGPKDRAAFLHAELERRIAAAKHALRHGHYDADYNWVPEP